MAFREKLENIYKTDTVTAAFDPLSRRGRGGIYLVVF